MGAKLRIRMDLKLYENSELVFHTTRFIKARIIADATRRRFSEGKCKVWYNIDKGYWNQFSFESCSELSDILRTDTEADLIREFIC